MYDIWKRGRNAADDDNKIMRTWIKPDRDAWINVIIIILNVILNWSKSQPLESSVFQSRTLWWQWFNFVTITLRLICKMMVPLINSERWKCTKWCTECFWRALNRIWLFVIKHNQAYLVFGGNDLVIGRQWKLFPSTGHFPGALIGYKQDTQVKTDRYIPWLILVNNKPENQDEDALGRIEQQQDFVILDLTLRVLDSYGYSLKISMLFMHRHFKNILRHFKIVLTHLENVLKYFKNVFIHFNVYAT